MGMADVYERVLIPPRTPPRKKTLEKNMFKLVKLNGWHDQNWAIQLLRDDETVHSLKRQKNFFQTHDLTVMFKMQTLPSEKKKLQCDAFSHERSSKR